MEQILSQKGKVAVITGGASGIGRATAELLSAYGARVCIVDINASEGGAAAERICRQGGSAAFYQCDITNADAVNRLSEKIWQDCARVDILFNNAGVIRRKTAVDASEQDWDLVVDVTLKGAFLMCRRFIPLMKQSGGGAVVNTGSGWGLKGGDHAVSYCAAKGGVVNMTRALAIDHGPDNIRVNCVCPGDTDTPLLRDEGRQLHIEEAAFLADSGKGRPLSRIGQPRDIANAVLFLVSDLASWITGTALVVDGGGIA